MTPLPCFFSDIVDFTVRSSEIEPVVLIAELSEIFGEFDRIFAHHGCERIKTIGDAYMSVSGLPGGNSGHCRALLRAAMDARAFLERRNKKGPFVWQMRMGVHTGRVVGGIVGKEKYIYDIFGDTVNIAARMENYSEPMQINVSEAVYLQTADDFVFDPRPPADVKGKGAMRMYFLRSEKIRD